jgi:hypothetical protein
MDVNEKLGVFAKFSRIFSITDLKGNPVTSIDAGKTVVCGPFRLVTKDQIARVTGIVTESMLNADETNNDGTTTGKRVYTFQGNGWCPQAKVGDILLQDVDNPTDRWACGAELFGGTGWTGTAQDDGSVTYAKPGKPIAALEIPEGTIVMSREGPRPAPAGCLLAFTKPDKGDFYIWTSDVVEQYVRPFGSS